MKKGITEEYAEKINNLGHANEVRVISKCRVLLFWVLGIIISFIPILVSTYAEKGFEKEHWLQVLISSVCSYQGLSIAVSISLTTLAEILMERLAEIQRIKKIFFLTILIMMIAYVGIYTVILCDIATTNVYANPSSGWFAFLTVLMIVINLCYKIKW